MRAVNRPRMRWLGVLVTLLVAGAGSIGAQQRPLLSGRVTDGASGAPIANARVAILGGTAVQATNADGRFSFAAVVTGDVRVRVNAIGYQSETHGTTVAPGQPAVVDFTLTAAAVQIDEIVTTATGEQSKLELGHVVAVVKADSIAAYTAVSNISDVLNSRTPGVTVQTAGGTTGGGTRIRIRGANSITLNNDPIFYIDGVRVAGNSRDADIDGATAGQSPSRINEINPDDIETIEIVKGPAAATLYGTDAANGVVLIKTKRGTAGRTTWGFYAEGGVVQDHNKYPDNVTAYGFRAGAERANCTLARVSLGACAGQDSIVSFNPLRDPEISPLGTGYRQQYGLNVSGGTDNLQYFVSGDFNDEAGVFQMPSVYVDSLMLTRGTTSIPRDQRVPNASRRAGVRSSVHAVLGHTADMTATFGWVNSDVRLPQNDNNIQGVLPQGLLGGTSRDAAWFAFDPGQTFSILTQQQVQRLTTSLNGNWRPTSWLATRLTLGLDQSQRRNINLQPKDQGPPFSDAFEGFKFDNKYTTNIYTLDVSAAGTKTAGNLSSRTTAGLQFIRTSQNGSLSQGQFFAPGSNSINSAAVFVAGETESSRNVGGMYLEEVVGYKERLFVTGAVRVDKASGFGQNFGSVFLPKAAISYLAIDRGRGFLNTVRLRGAYGQSAVQPGPTDAVQFLIPQQVALGNTRNDPGLTLGSLGNSDLRPERSREFEAGVDAYLLDSRLTLELTAYDKRTTDALLARPLAPSLGTGSEVTSASDPTSQFVNLGSVQNQGLELGLTARLLTGHAVSLDLNLTGSLLRNKVLTLGEGVTPFFFGLGGASQRVAEGYPIGGYWDLGVTSADANGDGIITPNEITVSDTAVYVGPLLPTRQLSANTGIGLFGNAIRISSTFDYRGGNYNNNSTDQFRCSLILSCAALYVPGTPLDLQASAIASTQTIGLMQKADFLRWRELSVTFFAPAHIARAMGATRASLTIAGRNLALWTKYHGVDPETNTTGQTNSSTADFFTLPPVRYWTARVNLNF